MKLPKLPAHLSPSVLLALTLLAGLLAVATLAPLRGSAFSEPTVLRPDRFVAVVVSGMEGRPDDRGPGRALRMDESTLGTPGERTVPQRVQLDSVAAAQRELRREVRVPSVLPESITGPPAVTMFTSGAASYTLDLTKINAALAEAGIRDVQLPPSLHGATLMANLPAGVVLEWGAEESRLALVQVRQPTLTVPGEVDVSALRELLLAHPRLAGSQPEVAAELRAIEEWRITAPVPVSAQATAQSVRVDGADGLLVSTPGDGSAVLLWQRARVVYALAGPFEPEVLLGAANSLR